MRSVLYGRWASRRSPVGRNRPVPQCHGGAAARGTCAACAALARLWRRTSATRDRPARQPHTARPTRRVSCRSQAVRSSWPCCAPLRRAHCRLRARRVARVALAETAWVRPQARAPPMRWRPAAASRICTSACAPDPGSKPEPKPKPKPRPRSLRTSLGLAATSSAGRQGPGVHVAHFLPDVPHRPERLAGREARADPGGAPARARPVRRLLEGGGTSYPSCSKI